MEISNNKSNLVRLPFLTQGLALFIVPFEETLALPLGSVLRIVNIMTIVIAILELLISSNKAFPTKSFRQNSIMFYFLFLVFAICSFVWCKYSAFFVSRMLTYLFYFAISTLLFLLKPSSREAKYLILCLFLGGLCAGILVAFTNSTIYLGGRETITLFGRIIDPNILSISIVISIVIGLYWLLFYRIRLLLKLVVSIFIAILLYSIFLLGSRGCFYALIVSLFFLIFAYFKKQKSVFVGGLVSLSLLALFVVFYFEMTTVGNVTRFSLDNLLGSGKYGSANRVQIWSAGFKAFLNRPIFGYGTGASPYAIQEFYKYYGSHNTFLLILIEYGLIGFAVFSIWAFKIIRDCSLCKSKLYSFIFLSLSICVFFVDGFSTKIFWSIMILLTSILPFSETKIMTL